MRLSLAIACIALLSDVAVSQIFLPSAALAEEAHPSTLREPAPPGPPPPEPSDFRVDNYRTPVPKTLAGARVIDTLQAEKLHETKGAIFIDVFPKPPKPVNLPAGTLWIDPKHDTIEGAHWVPNVGYGISPAGVEDYYRGVLKALSEAQPGKPLVFFCLHNCWMSWNAAKRAMAWGYKDVIWYPEGTDGWSEAGNDLFSVASEKP